MGSGAAGSGRARCGGVRVVIASIVAAGLFALAVSALAPAPRAAAAIPVVAPAGFLANSTQAVCALTGSHGVYTELPVHYTADDYGINSGDSGSSFEFDGKIWWLFGNSGPTTTGRWGPENATSRWSPTSTDPALLGSDAIATSPITTAPTPVAPYDDTTVPPNQHCPALTFLTETGPVAGAYANPSVFPDPAFATKQFVSLRIGELPESGIGEGNNMYVVFGTDNPANCASLTVASGPCAQPAPHHAAATICGGVKGSRTRSLVAVRTGAGVGFTGLYDLSAPTRRYRPLCPKSADAAKFVNVQIVDGGDGFIYIWGTEGGAKNDSSPVYLARMQAADIAKGDGIEYWNGGGWTSTSSPADFVTAQRHAVPLFTDSPAPCASQLGVERNAYLDEWIMLYHCKEAVPPPGHPNGIYMRTAADAWGPWSAPTTIFNPAPDPKTQSGFCYFIYSDGHPKCPGSSSNGGLLASQAGSLSLLAANLGISINLVSKHPGSYYGPYFAAGWTTGTYASYPTRASTTIYYTLDTFDPYGQLILRSTILGPPVTPSCNGKGSSCA